MSIVEKMTQLMDSHTERGVIRSFKDMSAIQRVLEEYYIKHQIPYEIRFKRRASGVSLMIISFYVKSEDALEIVVYDVRRDAENSRGIL